ncbi:MAG: AI-2E family transporter [Nitrospirae bacterium]|nr:AI-2E family transporter [Nitrospirota bacterium]
MGKGITSLIKLLAVLAVLTGAVLFLVAIGSLVKLIIVAALLAFILDPLASFLESRWMGRTSAVSVIFLSIIFAGAMFFFVAIPIILREVGSIQQVLSSGNADALISKIETVLKDKFSFLGLKDLSLATKVHSSIADIMSWLVSHALDIVSLLTDLIIVPFIVFFLLKDGRSFKKQFIGIVPNRYFESALNTLYKMELQLGNYLRGQFLDAVVVGILSTVALWILGIKYCIVFGALTGMANLVPYLGPVSGAAVTIIVTLFENGNMSQAAYIALAFTLVKLTDDVLIQPLIVAKSVDMHPLLVLLAVIIGGKFFGILGMLLSVPATGFIQIVIHEITTNYLKYARSGEA